MIFEKAFLPRISNSTFQRKIEHVSSLSYNTKLNSSFSSDNIQYLVYLKIHFERKTNFWFYFLNLSSQFFRKNPVTRIIVQDNYRSINRVVTGRSTIARQIFVSRNFPSLLVSSNFNSTINSLVEDGSWSINAISRRGGTTRNSNLNLRNERGGTLRLN